MSRLVLSCTAFLVIYTSLPVFGETTPRYQKGTIIKETGHETVYQLTGPNLRVWIKACGDFQTGQTVEYRIEGEETYIRRDNGNEYTCSITKRELLSADATSPECETGTIIGYKVRRDIDEFVRNNTRLAKVYELTGSKLVYQIDYCGAFQSGRFNAGQIVQFRVEQENDRLYIRHDGDKEYSCQLEGMRLIQAADSIAPSTGAPAEGPRGAEKH